MTPGPRAEPAAGAAVRSMRIAGAEEMTPPPEIKFREAIARSGLTPPETILADGKIHRFASNGKRTDDAGWYILFLDGIPAGSFGCWRIALNKTWRAEVSHPLTPAEEAALQAKMDAARRARKAEEDKRHAEAARKASAICKVAKPAPADNPYLTLKGVAPVATLREIPAKEAAAILGYAPKSRGEPLTGRLLVVAAVKIAGELSTLELIDEAGRKSALYGGAKAGGCWSAQPLPDGDGAGLTLLIGEGVATVLSGYEATGFPAVAALCSTNLLAVTREMRKRYPAAVLVILADLVKPTGDPDPHAEEAARAVAGRVAVPDFGQNRPEGLSDFNDLHRQAGLEAVARRIAAAAPGPSFGEGGNSEANHLDKHDEAQHAPGDATKTEPGLTDLGNAHRFARDHGADVRYCWPWGRWLVWNDRYWCRDETGEIHRLAEATVRGIYEEAARSSPERREVLAKWAVKCESHERRVKMLASAQAIDGIPIQPKDMDLDVWLLNVLNGTIDLRTGTLRPHAREDYITKCLDMDYNPDAQCPTWERFIREVFGGNAEIIAFVQRAVGYSLTGVITEHVLIVLYGLGSNGKTTLIDALHYLLGPYAKHAPTDLLLARRGEHHPTELAMLHGARLVTAAETGEGRRLAESLVKQLTGGDPVTARRMREDFWQFRPQFKLWLATNHKPQIKGTDHAIWRRIRLIPFDVVFHAPETGKAPQQDPTLPRRLREELPGILAWAVRGCLAWRSQGLGAPDAVRDATEAYRAEMDVFAMFFEERCVFDESAETRASELYRVYASWCEGAGERVESQRSFGLRLTEKGCERYRNNGIWYLGVRLRAME